MLYERVFKFMHEAADLWTDAVDLGADAAELAVHAEHRKAMWIASVLKGRFFVVADRKTTKWVGADAAVLIYQPGNSNRRNLLAYNLI